MFPEPQDLSDVSFYGSRCTAQPRKYIAPFLYYEFSDCDRELLAFEELILGGIINCKTLPPEIGRYID
jgi:hypothetical protein